MRLPVIGLAAFMVLAAPAPSADAARADELRAAVTRSLGVLDKSHPIWAKQALCASCHHQTQPLALAAIARTKGIPVNDAASADRLATVLRELDGRRDSLATHGFMPGVHVVISNLLIGAGEARAPASEVTDAAVVYLLGKQSQAGHWETAAVRFPNGMTHFFSTSTAVRALDLYTPPSLRRETDQRIAKARAWMVATPAMDTDSRAHRLNGLAWAKAPRAEIAKARAELTSTQAADGGWSASPGAASDAYATAMALTALANSGLRPSDSAYEAGVQYLLKTQAADGSWHVKAKALPIQPKIDGGFPYGTDQWISASATNLAATALAYAIP